MPAETTWFFEHLLCLPDVPDEIVHHFGALHMPLGNRAEGFRIPASVVCRLMVRHLVRHVPTGDVPTEHMLEIMGFIGALATQHGSHFKAGVATERLAPSVELLAKVASAGRLCARKESHTPDARDTLQPTAERHQP